MDDIAGLKWSSTAGNGQKPPTANYSAFGSVKPTPPASGRASPFPPSVGKPPSKPATPSNDSFANLVAFNSTSGKNLSLQEQQKRLLESKSLQQQSQLQAAKDQFAGGDDAFWNSLGNSRLTPTLGVNTPPTKPLSGGDITKEEDDDIFAAFNKPASLAQPGFNGTAPKKPTLNDGVDDDDPFGLSEFAARGSNTIKPSTGVNEEDDDDVLGLLGKPASFVPRAEVSTPSVVDKGSVAHPQDAAVAELVEMGFPAEKAKQALEMTDSGFDVQAAVGHLLTQAHNEARAKKLGPDAISRSQSTDGERFPDERSRSRSEQIQQRDREHQTRQRSERLKQTDRGSENEFERVASDFGNQFLKTAGSFWKQSTKRVQQAVQDFNSDSDTGAQPRWMRETEPQQNRGGSRTRPADVDRQTEARRAPPRAAVPQATEEALMLESSRPSPQPQDRRVPYIAPGRSRDHSPRAPSDFSDAMPALPDGNVKPPAFLRPDKQATVVVSKSLLNRRAADDEAAQAYTSAARRRKPQVAPQAARSPASSFIKDEFDAQPLNRTSHSSAQAKNTTALPSATQKPQVSVRPPVPARTIPPTSAITLQAIHSHREQGNAHFKRGDYSAAHQSYATSLTHIPDFHPLLIVLLTNRSLTALKIGEPKVAISDADKAMSIIGDSKGESETIDLGAGDNPKPMRDYYGKALMRKAEALEQMEKWADAATVWRQAVEGGHGGSTSIQGRLRAEKAAKPKLSDQISAATRSASIPAQRQPGPAKTHASTQNSAAAVKRLRAANLAAEKADDEKFRLSDSVDARIQAWKGGKADNLRALLGSLENVLWEGSGWKKISMADLVLPQKVKIQYMKGIAKVHPDKIPTDATTEQRMIAGSVFSALNEAWDKFKADNGL